MAPLIDLSSYFQIRGYNQNNGVDYFDMCAPIAGVVTIKVFIALSGA